MLAKVQFGCLQEREMTPMHDLSGNTFLVNDQYLYHHMQFELPEQDVLKTEINCPTCSHALTIRLGNLRGALIQLRVLLVVISLVCFGAAAIAYYGPGQGGKAKVNNKESAVSTGDAIFQMIALVFASFGVSLVVAAGFTNQIPVSLLKNELVSISSDPIRNPIPGNVSPRRHQFLDIQIS